jgi:hypothetical protein
LGGYDTKKKKEREMAMTLTQVLAAFEEMKQLDKSGWIMRPDKVDTASGKVTVAFRDKEKVKKFVFPVAVSHEEAIILASSLPFMP